jgi:hypothetical protein
VPISSPISPLSSPFAPSRNRRRATEKSLAGAPHVCEHHRVNSSPPGNPATSFRYPSPPLTSALPPDASPCCFLQRFEQSVLGRSTSARRPPPAAPSPRYWKRISTSTLHSSSPGSPEARRGNAVPQKLPEPAGDQPPGRIAGDLAGTLARVGELLPSINPVHWIKIQWS